MKQHPITARLYPAFKSWWWLCLLWSAGVSAGKIGYVDMDELINKSPQITAAREKLTAEFQEQYDALREKEADLEKLEQHITRDGPIMTPEELSKLQERARLLDRQVRRFKEDLKDAISIRNSQILDEIQAKLKATVTAYAQENGYDAILINAILYVSDEIDLTDEILQRLQQDREQPANKLSAQSPQP
jgi:outer membrane protein